MKDAVLGKQYALSVAIIHPREMEKHNRSYRKKDRSTDILAFPLDKSAGEILISMPDVKLKSKLFGMSEREYLAYLFLHGLVHLKGHDHGAKMETLEKKYGKLLGIQTPA